MDSINSNVSRYCWYVYERVDMGFLSEIFGGGIVKSVENIATELIETDIEKAEASTLVLKTLDPNGAMRRQISRTVSQLFVIYMAIMMILLLCQSFKIGDMEGIEKAITNMVDLFIPITSSFTAIVGASFGVNYANVKKGI